MIPSILSYAPPSVDGLLGLPALKAIPAKPPVFKPE